MFYCSSWPLLRQLSVEPNKTFVHIGISFQETVDHNQEDTFDQQTCASNFSLITPPINHTSEWDSKLFV